MEANNDIEVCVACGKADGTLALCRRCKRLACPNCPCVCDPAIEAAVDGIRDDLAPGRGSSFRAYSVDAPDWSRDRCEANRQLAELRRTGQLDPLDDPDDPENRCHRDGCQYPFAVCGCPRDPRFPPVWNREPSAELVGGAESIDWSAVVGACALVGLVVFFIVAVIVGAL